MMPLWVTMGWELEIYEYDIGYRKGRYTIECHNDMNNDEARQGLQEEEI